MGVTVYNKTKCRLRVDFVNHGGHHEIKSGESYKEKSGAFAIDENWTINTEFFDEEWRVGPSTTIKGIYSYNDKEWTINNNDLKDFRDRDSNTKKVSLFKNKSDELVVYNIESKQSSNIEDETISKIMKKHGSKYNISFDASGLVSGVTIAGKSEAEWTTEEIEEVETIKKEISSAESNHSGSILIPPHYELWYISRTIKGTVMPAGYSIKPI
jgi:hypothetical protein